MTVTNKKQMYQLFAAGAFGNRPQTWSKLSDLLASRFTGEVGMFLRDPRGGGGRVDYNVPVAIAAERTEDWIRHGIPANQIQYTEMAPHHLNLIQGEVFGVAASPWCPETCRWSLAYNIEVGLTMRQARQKWQQASAFSRHMLRAAMDSPSFDNLERLLHDYPDHAIEFSTFRRPVGVLNENTIFWEVRYY